MNKLYISLVSILLFTSSLTILAADETEEIEEVIVTGSQILADDMPVVNLFELEFLVVYNTKLKGAYGSAMGAYGSFREAYLDD